MLTIALDDARNIVEIMPNPILVIAPDLRVQTANRAFCRMFQVELSETEGKLLPELCDGAWDIPSLLEKLEAILRTGTAFSDFEIEQDYPGAGHKHLVVRATVTRLAGAGTKTALLAIEDLTTRQALLARETEARRDAEKANQVKDEFLATLSHELRTPLTAILSWAQILRLRDGADVEQTRRGVALIEKSGKDLGQLIEDLLDISRIQAGKVRLELREIDPLECIAAALDSVRTLADNKSIAIQTEFDPPSCRIQADSARLQQVFGNLLTNAVKFTPAGGTVTVRAKRQTTRLEIQVQDTGKGITPEFLPYVFKRFSQEDSSRKRAFGGLGLGLSIARSLAELHGGTVTADSPGAGKGALFTVTLPCGAACLPHKGATSESDQTTTLRTERPARLTGLRVPGHRRPAGRARSRVGAAGAPRGSGSISRKRPGGSRDSRQRPSRYRAVRPVHARRGWIRRDSRSPGPRSR